MNEHNYSSVSGWKIVGIIGRGNFGTVYEISRELPDCQEYAALKVITIPKEEDLEELQQNYGQDSLTKTFNKQMQDTFKEYSLMQKLSGNTNIVNVHDVEVVQHDNGIGWDILIRMELLTPLIQLVKEKELPEAQIVKLGKDLCRALALCGKSSIVHRDIKPQNIFVSAHGDYKLGDFGIAKISERTSSGTKAGTPRFMAPEVNNDEKYGGRADIYSLGLVMYWLLNEKRLPFMPKNGTLDDDNIARKRRLNGESIPEPAHGSEKLKTIVCKACAFHPEDRFSDAREMLGALETLSVSEEPIVIPPPVVKPLPPHEFVPFGGTTDTRTSTNDVSQLDVVKQQDTKLKASDETSSDGNRGTGTRRGRKTQEEIEKEKEDEERKKREEEQERERKEKEEKRKRLILFGSAGAVLLVFLLIIAFKAGASQSRTTSSSASVPASTLTPVRPQTPKPISSPTPTPKRPSIDDMKDGNETVTIPKDSCWLSTYETKYVKTQHGVRAYLRYDPSENSDFYSYVYEKDKVTVLARQNGYSLVKTSGGDIGWVTSSVLVDVY